MAPKISRETLAQRASLPIDAKIAMSRKRIKEWAEHWDDEVYVAFSGGKDSVALLHLVRSTLGEGVPAVFFDTGLEFPEIKQVVKDTPNTVVRRPKMSYRQVIERFGYPVISKQNSHALAILNRPSAANADARRYYLTGVKASGETSRRFKLPLKWRYMVNATQPEPDLEKLICDSIAEYEQTRAPAMKISERCCNVMKKQPAFAYQKESGKHPFTGEIATESRNRLETYLLYGCNAFDTNHPKSTPLAFWTEQDVLEYLLLHKLKIATVYGDIKGIPGARYLTGEQRTGCVWCMFGAEHTGPDGRNRFQRLAVTHPKIYRYCIDEMGLGKVLNTVGVDYTPDLDDLLK